MNSNADSNTWWQEMGLIKDPKTGIIYNPKFKYAGLKLMIKNWDKDLAAMIETAEGLQEAIKGFTSNNANSKATISSE